MDNSLYVLAWLVLTCTVPRLVECSCFVKSEDSCSNYHVLCQYRAGPVSNPSCSQPYNVTFVLQNISIDTLTSGFFSTTNFDTRVRHIRVTNSNINTIESSALRYYTNTRFIDLSYADIAQINNDAFSNLHQVVAMNLSHNKITYLQERSLKLPASDSESTLKILDLSNNLIVKLIADQFQFTPSLLELSLQNNKVVLMNDDCFSNLRSLTSLNLHNNLIEYINGTLIPLKNLKTLDMSRNSLKKLLGFELSRLVSLEVLNMSYNLLESVDGNCFSAMPNLQIVDFRNNKIKSAIESGMFTNNKLLKYVNFHENNINAIKENSFESNEIEYINFERNNITADLTYSILNGFKDVLVLNITRQHVKSIRNNAFHFMRQLKYLNLSRNEINIVENCSFCVELNNTSSLIVLDLSYNYIRDINFLKFFNSNITDLFVNNNKIHILSSGLFENHKLIRRLNITNNEIVNIAPGSLPLLSLQYLDLNNNNLSGIITNNTYSPAQVLRYLDLSYFKYRNVSEYALCDLPVLARLNLSHNELNYIHPRNFIGVSRMYSLDISYNNLSYFEIENKLDNVTAVYFNNNKFTSIPSIFSNESEVVYIDISSNKISNVSNAGFENVQNIKVLHMSNNQIEYFNCDSTNSLGNVSDLSLGSNKISNIDLSHFKNLVSIDLRNNSITRINSTMFSNLDFLQYLDLSANNISEIVPGTFQHLNILKLLNLSSNHISALRFGSFRGLNRTNVIDLSRNKLSSLDVDVFHVCIELKILVIDYNYIKTIDVDRLLILTPQLITLSLGGNPISCKEIVRNVQKNWFSRKVEITSIHQIFHEDNVHGIKCGDVDYSVSTESPKTEQKNSEKVEEKGVSDTTLFFIWATVLTLVVLISLGVFQLFKNRSALRTVRESRMQLRNSLEISSSECQNDLLG